MGPLILRQESFKRDQMSPLVSCGSSALKEVCKVSQKANPSLVVYGSLSEFVFCVPTILPPPGGHGDFTFRSAFEGITLGCLKGSFFSGIHGRVWECLNRLVPNFASLSESLICCGVWSLLF